MMLDGCWSGRETQHDVAAAVLDRQRNLPDFCRLVWVIRDAVNLQEVDAPFRILPQERVVPGLARLVVFNSPACGIPGTGITLVRCILSLETRPFDRRIARNTFTRDAADDVNAELQPLRVHPVRELFETRVLAVL